MPLNDIITGETSIEKTLTILLIEQPNSLINFEQC